MSEITNPSTLNPNYENLTALRLALRKGGLEQKSQQKMQALERIRRRKMDSTFAMGDAAASLGAGFSAILEGAGTVQGAVTGDMDNWLRNTGQENREWFNERKSLVTHYQEGKRADAIAAADGTLNKAAAAIWQTIDNPGLFSNFILEQLPNLAAGGAIGKGVGAAAKGVNALRGVTSATAATTAAGRGGVIGSSALHGADVASGTYDSLIGLGDDVWDANPEFRKLAQVVGREEAKKQIATNRTRAALGTATLASLVTQKVVPGGDVLEKTLAGAGKKSGMGVIGSTVAGGAAEGAQEVLEEGTGNVIGNVAVQSVDESQELTEGLGESIGLGLLGGATTGGGIGVMKGVANELADAAQDGPAAEQVVSPDLNTEKNRENIVSAITTGDESPLLNPEDKESYSPIHAMQVNDVISTDRERRLAAGEEAPRPAEDIRARSNRILKAQEGQIASLEKSLSEETDEATKTTLKRDLGIANNALKATRSSAEVINTRLAKEAAPAPEEKETMLEKIETAESAEEVTEEKERVLKLAMRTPDEFSDEDLSRLGQSQVLAQEERDYVGAVQQTRKDLEKVKQANNANKTLKQVNSEVLNGGEGFKGVSQYVQDASIALSDGDTATAETELEKLRAFYVNRDKKLAAVSEAQNLVESTGKPQFVKMDSATKEWSISDKIPKGKDHGGWVAYKSDKGKAATQKMIDVLSTEKAVLTSAGKQVGSAIGLVKSTQPATQNTPEVTPTETAATTPTAPAEPTVEAAPQVQAETVEAPAREQKTINRDDYKFAIDALDAAREATTEVINTAQRTVSPEEVKEATAGGFYSLFQAKISRHVKANGVQPGKAEEIRKELLAETLGEVDIHEQVTRALRTHTSLEAALTRFILGRADMAVTVNGILGALSGTKDFQALPAEVMGPIVEEYLNTLPLIQVSKKGENAPAPVTNTSSLQERAGKGIQESSRGTTAEKYTPSEIVIPEAVKGGLNTPELVAQYNARNTKIAEVNKGKVVTLNYGGRNPLDFKATFTGKVEQVGGSPSAPITQLQFKTNTGKIVTATETDIVSGDYINKSSEAVADVATPAQETTQPTTETVVPADSPIESAENQTTDESVEEQVETSSKRSGTIPQEDFKTANLVKEYFVRKKGGENSKSLNPLTTIKDFIRSLFDAEGQLDPNKLTDFLPSESGTGRQKEVFQVFLAFHDKMAPIMRASLENSTKTEEFKFKDPALFLAEDGKVSDNDVTAMVAAAFTYLAENAEYMNNMNPKEVKRTLGMRKEDALPSEFYAQLRGIGTRSAFVSQDIGKRAASAAGLKAVSGAPANTQTAMELSLGNHIIAVLTSEEYLVETIRYDAALAYGSDNIPVVKSGKEFRLETGQNFITVKSLDGVVDRRVNKILQTSKKTGGFLNTLFSIEGANKPPAAEEGSFKQKVVKNSVTRIPRVQKEAASRYANRAWEPRVDMLDITSALSETTLEGIAGIVDFVVGNNDSGVPRILDRNQFILEAKNNDIRRGMESFWDWHSTAQNKTFFLTPSIWKQQRAGNSSNMVNPQTDKFHRRMVTNKEWRTKIDIQNPASESNRLFLLAVAEGMGISVDKQYQETSLAMLDQLVTSPEFQQALIIVKESFGLEVDEDGQPGQLSQDKQDTLLAFVKSQGEGIHTLDALLNYAQYDNAKQGNYDFESDLMFEVDGVNNGPALAQVSLGTASNLLAGAFGMYGDTGPQSFAEFKELMNNDLYEQVDADLREGIAHIEKDYNKRNALTIMSMVGADSNKKIGRKFVKQPLTSLIFGSSTKKAIESMAADFIERFFDNYESLLQQGKYHQARNYLVSLNTLLGQNMQVRIPRNDESLWAVNLNEAQTTAVMASFQYSIGDVMGKVLDKKFGAFINQRDDSNKAAEAAWSRYNAAYEFLVNKFYKEGITSGEIPSWGKKNKDGVKVTQALQALPPETIKRVENILRPLQPTVHTAMSKMSNDISSGLYLGKFSQASAFGTEDEAAYSIEAKPGIKGKVYNGDSTNPKSKANYETTGSRRVLSEPGVGPIIMLTHAMDSAIAARSYSQVAALNIHDALGLGVKQIVTGAKALNRNTFNILAGYSIPMEISATLNRSFKAEADLIKQFPELESVLKNASIKRKEKTPWGTTEGAISITKKMERRWTLSAAKAELNKLKFLQTLSTIDQYALAPINKDDAGAGSYTITAEDKKALAARIAKIENFITTRFDEDTLNTQAQAVSPEVQAETNTEWGRVGTPVVLSDPDLVKLVETITQRKGNAKQLAKQAAKQVGKTNAYLGKLLQTLSTHVSEQIPVKYITPQSEFNSRDKGLKTARGWYSIDPGGDSVNIKSPDFVHSGITGELLAHELTHATVAHTIADWEEGKKLSPENKAIIDDLNGLYNIVKDGTQNGEFKIALKDLHEFISWGMTNPAFQKHMAGIQVEGQIVENTTGRFQEMATALKRFVKLLVDLVLPNTKKNAETRTALELTIHNTFQLLGQSARPEGKAQKARRFKMESNDARTFTSAQVLDALGKTQATPHSAKRVEQLQGILSSVVYAVYGAEGPIKAEIANNSPATAEEVYLHAKATGHTPFSSLVSARLQLSHQEEFVLESLEIAIRGSLQNSAVRRKELMSIYDQARKNPDIKAKLSKDEYAAIFSITGAKGNSADYLSRFAAAAMVYSPLTQILNDQKKSIDSRTRKGMNLAESLKLFIDKMVAYLNRLMTRTYAGESASVSIIRMVTDLATAENRRTSAIHSSSSPISDLADATGEKLATAVREGIKKTTESAFFTKSGSTLVQTAGMAVNIVASEQVEDFVKALDKVRNRMVTGRLGVGMDLVNEAKGETEENSWRYQLLNAADAAQRSVMKTLDNTATLVKDGFLRKMSEQESSSLTDVFVRTDAQALLGLYDLSQIEQMLTDTALLEKEILNTVNALKGVAGKRDIDYHLTSAKALAYYMATNKTTVPNLMLNAHNIAFKANTKSKLSRSRAVYGDSVATALEPLISLYALKYTPMPVRQIGSQILRDEINREDKGNGVELLLLLHREMQVSAKKDLFDGNPVSMIKGYIKDINDPYIDVIAEDAAKHDQMLDSGYELVGKLDKAANDFTLENRNLYRIKDRALAETVSGALSTTAKKSRGHALNSGSQVNIVDGEVNPFAKIMNKKSTDKIDAGIAAMFKNGEAFDPTKVKATYTSPIIDHKGNATNYRYMMSLDTKRDLLNPTNQVDKIMGTIAASTLNKVQTPITNKRGIDAIYEEYQQKFAKEPNAFIAFGPESPDPEIRDRYNTLPDEAKAYIRQKFGTDTIRIHNQSYNMMFGYRKFTLASLFDTIPEERDLMTKLFVGLAEHLIPTVRNGKVVPLGKQAALRMSQGGAMWDEAVQTIKDALVIKTGFTLMGNESSNATVLMLAGVPINYIAKKKVEAYGFTMDYLKHEKERFHLNQQLAIGTSTVLDMDKKPITADAARQRVVQLDTEIENSPVKDLMDDGMFSTLVEDINQEKDPYSYRNKLARWSDEKTAKLPPWVKSGAKQLFLAHDTTLYQVLNSATIFSDFTSRYVMYEYLTKEAKKPMSQEAALREARKSFVSYNVPTHKGIQYANDKGLLWFTKYYVRIQTVIAQLVKRNPARAVGVLALGDYIFNFSDILDSSVVDHWPVNVGGGALELPGAVAEILPVKGLTELLGIGE